MNEKLTSASPPTLRTPDQYHHQYDPPSYLTFNGAQNVSNVALTSASTTSNNNNNNNNNNNSSSSTTSTKTMNEVSGLLQYTGGGSNAPAAVSSTTPAATTLNMNMNMNRNMSMSMGMGMGMGIGMGMSIVPDGNIVMLSGGGGGGGVGGGGIGGSVAGVTSSVLPCGNLKSGIGGEAALAVNLTSTTTTIASSSSNSGNINPGSHHKTKRKCCSCFRNAQSLSSPLSNRTSKSKPTSLWIGLITNLGICLLLFAYTLLGSFIFLMIENEDSSLIQQQQQQQQQRTLASTKRQNSLSTKIRHSDNTSIIKNTLIDFENNEQELDTYDMQRQRTIENIWDITVSLNILYKENWTKLAALEIAKFQDQLIKRLNEDAVLVVSSPVGDGNSPATEPVLLLPHKYNGQQYEWNFAKAFLYSLTVLTTIGYGNIAPKTTLGRLVTLAYAILGIPLTLVYLSSTGGVLARVAREVFSRALCCCLCSNCGYCCYDEKRMAEKERRMKRKRQQEEMRSQQAAMQEPYYVRPGSLHNNIHSPEKQPTSMGHNIADVDSLSASDSRGSMHGLSILAPILLCLTMMIIYIIFGALALYRLENWPILDGIYFCFMSLSTIGFGDLVPGLREESTTTTWFCSIYIMSGMALTAMCFNVIHEEIVHRIKIVVEFKNTGATLEADDSNFFTPP